MTRGRQPKRPLSYAASRHRTQRREFLREHRRSLALMVVAVVAGFTPMLLTSRNFTSGILAGTALASLAWTIYGVVVIRGYNAYIGMQAERWTTKMLRKAPPGWWSIPNVPFEKYDVDQVVLTPDAVLAVEVKWRPTLSEKDAAARHEADLRQAQKSAQKITSLLRTAKLHEATVIPMLLLWGPGIPDDLKAGRAITGGVHVVDGNEFGDWQHEYDKGYRLLDRRDAIRDLLLRHAAMVEQGRTGMG